VEFCLLASGSSGNALHVRSGTSSILVDCGMSYRALVARFEDAGLNYRPPDGVLLTHEHTDHVSGAPVIAKKGVALYVNAATRGRAALPPAVSVSLFEADVPFDVGVFEVTAFSLPHDAADPVGFTISDGSSKLGIATDLGSLNLEVLAALSGCDAVVIESNHDSQMLAAGPYPPMLKRRVAGSEGHLSNSDAASLLDGVRHRRLAHVALAHLSRVNNTPELTLESAVRVLGPGTGLSLGWQYRAGEIVVI